MKSIHFSWALSLLLCLGSFTSNSQDIRHGWARTYAATGASYTSDTHIASNGDLLTTTFFTDSVDVDFGPNVSYLEASTSYNSFVQRSDDAGNILWTKFLSSTGSIQARNVVTSSTGDIYVVGSFTNDADFDPSSAQHIITSNGYSDGFLLKLDSNGNFQWVKIIGGYSNDAITSIKLDASGNFILGGHFVGSVDMDPGPGVVTKYGNQIDGFILKLDANANYQWVMEIKGSSHDYVADVEADGFGNVYAIGSFGGAAVDMDSGPGVQIIGSHGYKDAFVIKYNSFGNFQWVKRYGGAGSSYFNSGNGIHINQFNQVFVTGAFYSSSYFGSTFLSSSGSSDVFIQRLDVNGNTIWAHKIGASSDDRGSSITSDNLDGVYFSGTYRGLNDFDPGPGSYQMSSNFGMADIYTLKLDTGGLFKWVSRISGTGSDAAFGSIVDLDNSVHIFGSFNGTADFDPTFAYDNRTASYSDGFVQKIRQCTAHTYDTISVTTCGHYTGVSGTKYWNISGTYQDVIPNSIGCDSIITVNLTIKNPSTYYISMGVCDSLESPSGNYTWTTSGVYYDTIQNVAGCDSLMTFNLTVYPSVQQTLNQSVCGSYTSPSGNFTWNTSGTYSDTLSTNTGCDSVLTIYLTVLNPSTYVSTVTICDSYDSPSGNYTWTTSGTYMDTLQNSVGCDSVITTHLTILTTTTSVLNLTVCDSMVAPSGSMTWYTDGTYYDTLNNSLGCDSIITVHLQVGYSSYSTLNEVSCDAYTSPSGHYVWTNTGSYQDTIQNYDGCDSVMTINLTILNSNVVSQTITVCDSFVAPSGTSVWTSSGMYYDTLQNVFGCDSIVDINLTVLSSTYQNRIVSNCGAYTSPSGHFVWNTTGTYQDTLVNFLGCDSVVIIDLTILQSTASTVTANACNSYTSPSGLYTWTQSGTYNDTLINAVGCDSIITVTLTIGGYEQIQENVVACNEYIGRNGQVWTESGTYMDTVIHINDCDTIFETNLIVNTVSDLSVIKNGNTLTAQASNAHYQWINCADGSLLDGEINQSFTATVNGEYAAIITEHNCTDTTNCYTIDVVGIEDVFKDLDVKIYPNPTKGTVNIKSSLIGLDYSITVSNSIGQIVYKSRGEKEFYLDHPVGVYFVTIQIDGNSKVFKLIKK